jgi:hypothetical protein
LESFVFHIISDSHSWQSDPKGYVLLTVRLPLLFTYSSHLLASVPLQHSIDSKWEGSRKKISLRKTITNLEPINMTATTEWAQVESSMDSIAPPSSDDLFDGDILGDELMDIYNAAVVGGGSDDDEAMNGM